MFELLLVFVIWVMLPNILIGLSIAAGNYWWILLALTDVVSIYGLCVATDVKESKKDE